MVTKNAWKIMILLFLGGVVLTQSTNAYAWHWHYRQHKGHWSDRQHNEYKTYKVVQTNHPQVYGTVIVDLPFGAVALNLGGEKYHYHQGRYYKKSYQKYQVVRAPRGICIPRMPFGYKTAYIKSKRYYIYDDVYYIRVKDGYQVVDDPNAIYEEKDFTVSIPNEYGGYTSIKLTRQDDGFVGPQGEYYEEFPKVAQLQVMYGGK
ncbi:MAG: hypothetical protein KC684_00120 [Candidatus Omnitrophica bacterium]|nr:hypothetical protein [Candidatus Omnitrophota bacterium]